MCRQNLILSNYDKAAKRARGPIESEEHLQSPEVQVQICKMRQPAEPICDADVFEFPSSP